MMLRLPLKLTKNASNLACASNLAWPLRVASSWYEMSSEGGVHSTLTDASAFAEASHSALAFGGVTSPSHLPVHMTEPMAMASHFTEAPASHEPLGGV